MRRILPRGTSVKRVIGGQRKRFWYPEPYLTFGEARLRMRRSPRNLRIACDHRGLTHFGGIYFFHEFLQLLQLRDFLARHLSYPRRNHRYSLSQMILALVYPLVLGLDRLETTSFLRSNGSFQYLTGLPGLRYRAVNRDWEMAEDRKSVG